LTAAEAATPVRDVDAHVAKVQRVLMGAKSAVENGTDTSRPKQMQQV